MFSQLHFFQLAKRLCGHVTPTSPRPPHVAVNLHISFGMELEVVVGTYDGTIKGLSVDVLAPEVKVVNIITRYFYNFYDATVFFMLRD